VYSKEVNTKDLAQNLYLKQLNTIKAVCANSAKTQQTIFGKI
jgi:hypothetical protein